MTLPTEKSNINVTPLIDVLLVLLIIFMVITPLTPHGLSTELPQNAAAPLRKVEPEIVLEITQDHHLLLNGTKVARAELAEGIAETYRNRVDLTFFIQANQSLEYQEVAQVIDAIRGGDRFIRVGLLPSQR